MAACLKGANGRHSAVGAAASERGAWPMSLVICVPLVIPEIRAPNQAFAIPGARHNQTDPLPMAKAENLASYTASSATQCRSNPVSDRGLPKTGIFQISAGDYQRFRSHRGRFRSLETDSRFAKARHWRAFLSLLRAKSPVVGLPGWSERIRTRAFPIEPGLCVNFLEFGNMAGSPWIITSVGCTVPSKKGIWQGTASIAGGLSREAGHRLLRVVLAMNRCLHRPSPLPAVAAFAA
jgi:hypothetical protein